MAVGKIKQWSADRQQGVIITSSFLEVYVDKSQVRYESIRQGDIVHFVLRFDSDGPPRALNVYRSRFTRLPEPSVKNPRDLVDVARTRYGEALIARDEALASRTEKHYQRARELFEEALSLNPEKNFFEAYAAMEERLGQWDKVREIYRRASKCFPHDVSIVESLAMAERRAGNLDQCVEILRNALKNKPDRASLHFHLAGTLVDLADKADNFNMLEEAKEHFNKAFRIDPRRFDPGKVRQYHKMWILDQPRSRVAWLLFRQAGFRLVKWNVTLRPERDTRGVQRHAPVEAWILADPGKSQYSSSYHLDAPILIYCNYTHDITQAAVRRAEGLLQTFVQNGAKIKPDILFMTLPRIDKLHNYLRSLLEDPESHPTVVPLEEFKVEKLNADSPQAIHDYLNQLLSEWLFQRDLYKANLPVSGRMFFGREKEIGLLNRNIEEGRPVGIFGLRKCGKTSLMHHLKSIRTQDLVAYIDPETSPIRDASWLCWSAIQQLVERCGDELRKSLSLSRIRSEKDLPNFPDVAVDFVNDIRTLMNSTLPQTKLILMIDEIEKVVPAKGESWAHALEFFRLLRGITQGSPGRLVTIIAGANPAICEAGRWGGEDNPVFQFFEEMFLPLLPENECKEMIVALGADMGVEWEDETLRLIYNLTGGHPFVTRKLCSTVVANLRARPLTVTPDKIKELEREFTIRVDEMFAEIRDRLKQDYPDEWDVLEAVASGFSLEDIKQLVPNHARALRHLEGYQLIELVDGQPRIKVSLLERWLTEGSGDQQPV